MNASAQSLSQKPPRVMLMYISKVSGHRQATLAIQQMLREFNPKVIAPTINGFGYTYPILEKVVNRAYMSVIKRTPQIWDMMYDNPKIVKNSQSIKKFLHKTSHDKIARLINRHQPDTVVCTQAFPCGMIADYKTANKLNIKLVGVLTDFAPHSFWINEGVDYYVVPSEDARERFIQKGVNPNSIKVYGIPLHPKFSQKCDRRAIAQSLGLSPDVPTILIMGGGQGLGPIKKIFKSLLNVSVPFQVIVLAGTNKKVIKQIQKEMKKTTNKVLLYEFANNVEELMELSSIIVSKPGGLTTAESLAKGLPMIIVNPLPGQEMRNTDFLIKSGIAIRVDDPNDVGEEVELLLKSPKRLAQMSHAAKINSRPNSTRDVAKLILKSSEFSSELVTN